jgi:hypothetical protein
VNSSPVDGGSGEDDGDEEAFIHPISRGVEATHYAYLLGYIFEFFLAIFVYNPLILTIVFTGVLGNNGRIPLLGGRPREVMMEQHHAMKQRRKSMLPNEFDEKTLSLWNSTVLDP